MSKEDVSVREVLLEMRLQRALEELHYLKEKLKHADCSMQYVEEPYETTVQKHNIQNRTLEMVAGVDARIEFHKLNVYGWYKDVEGPHQEFRLGYFLDPLVKTTVFDLAQQLGDMHYRFVRNIADHYQAKYGDVTIKYDTFRNERKQNKEFKVNGKQQR